MSTKSALSSPFIVLFIQNVYIIHIVEPYFLRIQMTSFTQKYTNIFAYKMVFILDLGY